MGSWRAGGVHGCILVMAMALADADDEDDGEPCIVTTLHWWR